MTPLSPRGVLAAPRSVICPWVRWPFFRLADAVPCWRAFAGSEQLLSGSPHSFRIDLDDFAHWLISSNRLLASTASGAGGRCAEMSHEPAWDPAPAQSPTSHSPSCCPLGRP